MNELYTEYWKKRCELAEKCLKESPCDPDITKAQIEAHQKYNDFLVSVDATALLTGFNSLLDELGLGYEHKIDESNPDCPYKISFWFIGTDYEKEGYEVYGLNWYEVIECAIEIIKRERDFIENNSEIKK